MHGIICSERESTLGSCKYTIKGDIRYRYENRENDGVTENLVSASARDQGLWRCNRDY